MSIIIRPALSHEQQRLDCLYALVVDGELVLLSATFSTCMAYMRNFL